MRISKKWVYLKNETSTASIIPQEERWCRGGNRYVDGWEGSLISQCKETSNVAIPWSTNGNKPQLLKLLQWKCQSLIYVLANTNTIMPNFHYTYIYICVWPSDSRPSDHRNLSKTCSKTVKKYLKNHTNHAKSARNHQKSFRNHKKITKAIQKSWEIVRNHYWMVLDGCGY